VLQAGVCIALILWLAPRWGVQGAAIAMLLSTIATAPLNFALMSRAVGLTVRDLWTIVWRPATATLVMVGAVLIVAGQGWSTTPTLQANAMHLVAAVATGAAVYCGTVFVLWRIASPSSSAEGFLLKRLEDMVAAIGGRVRAWRSK
jgi:O-antigen/teichoic acid export membrane protein